MLGEGLRSHIRIKREPSIEEARLKLPAVLTEQEIIDAVRNNDFSIVSGDTGCGKSTQVPQFLYEASFTEGPNAGLLIGVTQPRRVAAVSLAQRVGVELNNPDLVGYQVRYDKKIKSDSMRLKFMTDGILLREIQEDIRLSRYSVIVVDEAHERSINCDMLLGLLSGSIRARKSSGRPLKVVIMSATLRISDFVDNKMLFPRTSSTSAPAVVKIDNSMHPVVVHYERRTEDDYVALAIEKIKKIHNTLPAGTILVFLTGKAEVHKVCEAFSVMDIGQDDDSDSLDGEEGLADVGETEITFDKRAEKRHKKEEAEKVEVIEESSDFNLGQDGNLVEELSPSAPSTSSPVTASFTGGGPGSEMKVIALYAQMASERQMEAFSAHLKYPDSRVVVIATNVAETSLTIPNVRYVIDCGREKRKEFNSSAVSRFAVRFTSKASANQRAGRAGRLGPGHVYRLYSPNVFGEHMCEHSSPEVELNPLDSALLFLKSMGVPSFSAFPWPSPPPALHVDAALRRLKAIGAINPRDEKLTLLGKQVSLLPLSPRLSVAVLAAIRRDSPLLLLLLLALVSMLSVDCLSSSSSTLEDKKFGDISKIDYSDDLEMMLMLLAESLSEQPKSKNNNPLANPKGLAEAKALFLQLARQVGRRSEWQSLTEPWKDDPVTWFLHAVETTKLFKLVRECCSEAFIDQIAVKDDAGTKQYRVAGSELVTIHRSSACHRLRPNLIAFFEIHQASGEFGNHKRSLRICFPVDSEYLASIESPLIDKSKNHPFMKPCIVNDSKFRWAVAKYTPLGLTLSECVKVALV